MIKSLIDFPIKEKKVLIRCDFNLLIDGNRNILETFKIDQTIPTIRYLLQNNAAKIILLTHLGDPGGKVVENLRIDPIQRYLETSLQTSLQTQASLQTKIEKVEIDKDFEEKIKKTKSRIIFLENIRFYHEEEENDLIFAKRLAQTSDLFVNEAFGVCHRRHSSIVGIPQFINSCAGFLLQREVKTIDKFLKSAEKPVISIIGGSKIKTKVPLINALAKISNFVIISGLIKNEAVVQKIKFENKEKIIAPKKNWLDKDINKEAINLFQEKIKTAKTIFWNGPFGRIEEKKYSYGTYKIAEAIIESKALSIVGGGETVSFINKNNLNDKFSHISTGGGALLEYIINQTLPGIEVLQE